MPGGMMLVDRDLNYVLLNAQYSELCNFPDGLLEVGGSIRDTLRYQADRGDFGLGDKHELVEEVLAVYRQGEAASWQRTIASSGRSIEIHVAPTPEGGYVSILTDITDMVESQRGAKLLQEALDNISDMVVLYDKDERVIFTNDRYHEFYPNSPPRLDDRQREFPRSARPCLRGRSRRGRPDSATRRELTRPPRVGRRVIRTARYTAH